MEEQCRVNDILTQLMRSRQLICLMLFVEGIWMLSMGSFIFTQPNEALSPGKKGTHCFHLCDAPSTVPVLSIILNKLISGWVARNIKILLCCLLVYLLFLGLPVFGLFFFFEAEICSGNIFSLDHSKETLQINFSTSVWRHIDSNYVPCYQEEICFWKSSACDLRSSHQTEYLSAV